MTTYVILAVAALLGATISAILGTGGGILLLAVIFSFLRHAEAIPVHAAVQLVSNSTRVVAYLNSVDWRTVARFLAGAIPGGLVGGLLYWRFGQPQESEPILKAVVGGYILVVLFLPKPAKRDTARHPWWDFPLLGVAAGGAALTVGAVGPLIAPLFVRRGFVKERLVATKAVCQACLHVLKIPVFMELGSFDWQRFGTLTLLMVAMVIPGTFLGRRMLKGVTETAFVRFYQLALFTAGCKVLGYDGLYKLLTR